MFDTAESVKPYGVLVPAIARPRDEGGYELVAGHHRKRACELAELETLPAIVRNLDDDAATIIMVDSNLQRETLLPSERAFAFKMKLETITQQGARTDLTSTQVAQKLSVEKVGESAGVAVQAWTWYCQILPLSYIFFYHTISCGTRNQIICENMLSDIIGVKGGINQ